MSGKSPLRMVQKTTASDTHAKSPPLLAMHVIFRVVFLFFLDGKKKYVYNKSKDILKKSIRKDVSAMKIFNNAPFRVKDTEKLGIFKSFAFANESERQIAIELADNALDYEIPFLPATLYMEYARNGNRTHYENPYHERRSKLRALLLGCLATGDAKYTDKMVDLVWAILEETSWVIPAHNVAHPYELAGEPLPDAFGGDDVIEIDLFAAETAALLAFVYHFEKARLDAVTPVICKRIEYEIDRRILRPYRTREMRWMTNFINNWTPWIVSNVLSVSAIFVKEWHELSFIISVSMGYLDRFAETYGEDGGCDEGPNYWTAAVAALFDAVCILHDITGGTLNKFQDPMLIRMCEYLPNVCVSPEERLYANFADGPRHVNLDRRLFTRMGKLTGSKKLQAFASALPEIPFKMTRHFLFRELLSLTEPLPEKQEAADFAEKTSFYPNLQLAVLRRGEYFLAIKGGHNRESHNHNDIGSFILYRGTTPVIVDAGVGVYTKDTFSEKRYTIWTMQSSYHNLPEIDGMMQLPGREHRADSFTLDGDTVSVSYRSAYPKDMPATAVTRTLTATDEGIVIFDEVKGAKSAIFNLLLAEKPEKIAGGFAVGTCHVRFDGDYTVDEVDLTSDASLHNDWQRDALYRVRIPTSGTLKTVITKGE